MKKLLFLILFLTGVANAQIVNIPDANFKAILTSKTAVDLDGNNTFIDANRDGEIQVSEAFNISSGFSVARISDLTGIEAFVNIRTLILIDVELTSIDISKNIKLTEFECRFAHLTSLDVSKNVELTSLDCWGNSLTSLDVSKNLKLSRLFCSKNELTSLDVSKNLELEHLRCSRNKLTSLDVSKNLELKFLHCDGNQLLTLDVTNNVNLSTLIIDNNNPLSTLFIKNGKNETVNVENNPNLTFICADESQIKSIKLERFRINPVEINSYCSFVPGGDFNTISGVFRFDGDNNGCDINDSPQPNIKIGVHDGTNQGATLTNTMGSYAFNTNEVGDFDITPNIENPSWFSVSPATATISFTEIDNSINTQNFCVTANGVHNDVEVIISPITPARPGFDAEYKVVFKNKGNQTLSGVVDIAFDDSILDYISASTTPDSQSAGNLSWNYTGLLPFESRNFELTLNVNSPMETPAVNNDDVLNFTATINPVSSDELPEDNVFQFDQVVVGSYDPNDITCLEGDLVDPSTIGEYLHYLINFENTGTAAATFIVVKNIVDTAKYDINTLQIMSASHSMITKITGDKVEFIFDDINLEANGKGNIVFKVKSLNTLVTGDAVTKKADIYFDYNFPIETNFATTSFENALSNNDFEIDNSVSIFPNPTTDMLNVKADSSIHSLEIYDIQGRIVLTKLIDQREVLINISHFKVGTYFLKINTEIGVRLQKIIKD